EEDCGAVDSFHSSVELWRYRHGISSKLFGNQKDLTTVLQVGHDPRLLSLNGRARRRLSFSTHVIHAAPASFAVKRNGMMSGLSASRTNLITANVLGRCLRSREGSGDHVSHCRYDNSAAVKLRCLLALSKKSDA